MKYATPVAMQHLLVWPHFPGRIILCFFSIVLCCGIVEAQMIKAKTIVVRGVVTGQDNEPLQGATIVVKGTSRATTTQTDGSFQIDVPENSTLTFSSIGYSPQDVRVGASSQPNFSVQLTENKNQLDQVVVVGYGTRRRSDVTGSIVSISEQSIKDIPAANIAQALQGQAAGIDIQKTVGTVSQAPRRRSSSGDHARCEPEMNL